MPDPAPRTVARDLALRDFRDVPLDAPLHVAMAGLIELRTIDFVARALVVLDPDGAYAGLLTSRLLFRGLLTLWLPSRSVTDDEHRLERELLRVARDRLDVRVRDALIHGLPTAAPEDPLISLIALASRNRAEYIPVVDSGKPIGLVPITNVLQHAAELALTPQDEGIQHEGKRRG